MPRFVFRLDPVLAHRKRLEDEQQRVLAIAQKQLAESEALRDAYIAQRDETRGRIQHEHQQMSGDDLRAAYARCAFLDREIDAQQLVVDERRKHVAVERGVLLERTREKKVLETLRDRRREAFDREIALAEQRESDELNARQFERSSSHWEIAP